MLLHFQISLGFSQILAPLGYLFVNTLDHSDQVVDAIGGIAGIDLEIIISRANDLALNALSGFQHPYGKACKLTDVCICNG